MNGIGFSDWMAHIQLRTETALAEVLPDAAIAPERLHEAMRYAVLGGGKRVRPLLVHAAGELSGAPVERLDRLGCAVELIHAYSLVHDDMPCMDDDVLRRGRPTVHVEYDEATALLAGDALQTLAFQTLTDLELADSASAQLAMVGLLAAASGSRGMAGGQAIDLASVGKALERSELEFMHIHKTGALIRAAVLLGARAGKPLPDATLTRLDHYAGIVGLLFQVVDDILDAEADTATLGKTAGKDADHDKPTYVSLLGLDEAKRLAAEMLDSARACLAPLGPRADRLVALADFIVHRTF
ncbi:polyprenyl synthetase family protein [Thauera phenolivorans]|uniref:polyprenyl synthetase family protein n=1 Tax=Thauera phenolivorans TaxID=1792543 RepID=UPI000839F25F|nr:farnesyl diphosphate synthase [Thauera phenolivorans]